MPSICFHFHEFWLAITNELCSIAGSFICDCLDTFTRDPKSDECVCADGFEARGNVCTDIDECAGTSPCRENEVGALVQVKKS